MILLVCFPWALLVALLACCSVSLLVCDLVGLLPRGSVSYSVGLLIGLSVALLACYPVALLVTLLAWCLVSL